MPLYNFVRRYFIVLLFLLLAGNFFVYRLMHQNSNAMKNNHAPLGIISLEIATTKDRISKIVDAWEETLLAYSGPMYGTEHWTPYTALDVAKRQTKIDFFFLLFYSHLLALLLVRMAPVKGRANWVRIAVLLSLATGLMDGVENIFMLKAMNYHPVAPWTIWLPSGAKWVLLLLLVFTILYRCGNEIFKAFKNNRNRDQQRTEKTLN